VLTVAHNKFERNGAMVEEQYATHIALDIEGNQREVIDANDRVVMRYDYSIAGPEQGENGKPTNTNRVHQASMEAGERWMLNDVTGKPIRAWDSRNHQFRTAYDSLRRPTESFLQEDNGPEVLIARTLYGESQANPETKNQRGKVVQLFDQAGVVTTEDYDFKGNLLSISLQLAKDYKNTLDWSANPELETETFTGHTTYDALNRPISATSPDGSIYRPTFNEANLLEKVDVNLRGAATATSFVTNIDYDAKGQRMLIEYGNGVRTTYGYDPLTFRLMQLQTLRSTEPLQDLRYTYDPVGNIIHIQDDAQQTIYFKNQVVESHNDYVYDAIYRLIEAQSREHIGQASQPETTWSDEFRVKLPHPQDGQAMRRYTERYEYDPVGNFEKMIHQATNGNWTRTYAYNEASLLEFAKHSNRLSSTIVGRTTGDLPPEIYPYDAHGNMLAMAHLPHMDWDFKDRLRHVSLGGGGDAYYVYDAGGQRIRKVVEKNGGTLIEERIYLGGFEVFRQRNGAGTVTLERETLHVMDDKQRIALIETKTKDTSQPPTPNPQPLIRYQFGNHLGSASLELDGAGQIISYEEYYLYGSTSYQAGRSGAEVSLKRYRYTGKERDEETGFSYHGARYCAAWLGVWIAADPSGVSTSTGLNLYVYARANPVVFRDPDGREPEGYHIEGHVHSSDPWGGEEEWQTFAGKAAHILIAWDYRRKNPDHEVYTNFFSIASILRQSGAGDPAKVDKDLRALKPDITDITTKEVYEIKPKGAANWNVAFKEAVEYQKGLNQGLAGRRGYREGFSLGMSYFGGELGVKFEGGVAGWRLVWALTGPGVIQYSLQRLNPKKQSEAGFKEAYENGWWVEVSEPEMKQHAKRYYEAIESYLGTDAFLSRMEGTYGAALDLYGMVTSGMLMGAILDSLGGWGAVPQRSAPGAPAPAPTPAITPSAPPARVIPLRPAAPPAPAQPPPQVVPLKKAA
jgi:RHS repeat-associated protein